MGRQEEEGGFGFLVLGGKNFVLQGGGSKGGTEPKK